LKTVTLEAKPIKLKADGKNRLQIPATVRRTINAAPGQEFNLTVTTENGLYFAKAEK
jgi:bifunctional DNA-binding transcriptional regulator/antitoxin component of YhaV-PrlF toxin-antitoxin module